MILNNVLLSFKFSGEIIKLMKFQGLEIQYFVLFPLRVIEETKEIQDER